MTCQELPLAESEGEDALRAAALIAAGLLTRIPTATSSPCSDGADARSGSRAWGAGGLWLTV